MALFVYLLLMCASIKVFFVSADSHCDVPSDSCSCCLEKKNQCDLMFSFRNPKGNKDIFEFSMTESNGNCITGINGSEVPTQTKGTDEWSQNPVEKIFEISPPVSWCNMRAKLNFTLNECKGDKVRVNVSAVQFFVGPNNNSISNPSFSCSSSPNKHTINVVLKDFKGVICNNTSLKFNLTHVSWIEALQICRSLKSELVQMKNQTVWDELKSLLKDKKELEKEVWVGLERSIFGTNLQWKWISGTNLLETFTPKDPLNNHCGKIVRESEDLKLLDENCHKKLPFICQGNWTYS